MPLMMQAVEKHEHSSRPTGPNIMCIDMYTYQPNVENCYETSVSEQHQTGWFKVYAKPNHGLFNLQMDHLDEGKNVSNGFMPARASQKMSYQTVISDGSNEHVPGNNSPDSTRIFKVELYDGSVFFGNILQQDSNSIIMRTPSIPKLELLISSIKSIDEIDPSNFKNESYWFPNPHATRYLYAPSAFNLKKGEGYYQNTLLVLNSFNVGITDNISIGGGLELFSTFAVRTPFIFITPKVGFKVSEKFHAGGGVLFVRIPETSLGTIYGTGTYGSKDHNITNSLGWGFVDGEFSLRPIITLSGMTRISKRTALVSENWFIPASSKYYGLISYGIRFFGESMAIDLAFINNADIVKIIFIGIPYVSFVVKF